MMAQAAWRAAQGWIQLLWQAEGNADSTVDHLNYGQAPRAGPHFDISSGRRWLVSELRAQSCAFM